jgi:hypothetical protein
MLGQIYRRNRALVCFALGIGVWCALFSIPFANAEIDGAVDVASVKIASPIKPRKLRPKMAASFSCDDILCPDHGRCFEIDNVCHVQCKTGYSYAPGLVRCVSDDPCSTTPCPINADCKASEMHKVCIVTCKEGHINEGVGCILRAVGADLEKHEDL